MTKNYLSITIVALIIIAVGFWIWNTAEKDQETQISTSSEPVISIAGLETQINNEGAVGVTVTPRNISEKEWSFKISLNTHSRDLGEDLAEVSVLLDENGNEHKPLAWEGDPPGGHHRSGILRFGEIEPAPQSITLVIRQIGGIEKRSFNWQLK